MSMIQITDLTFCYDGSFDNIFEHVSFQIDTDWKLGFIGRNGRGKTTFLKLLLKEYEYTGSITSSALFEYFPYGAADESLNTMDVLNGILKSAQLWEIERELSLLEVSEDVLYRPFSTLSSGEQTKVLLAVLFLKENSFLLIDEPTNHLDKKARECVGRYLKGKKGYILVSHDRTFLDSCIDHILSINKTKIEIQKGNFSSWWENKKRQDEFELAEHEKLKRDISHLKTAAKKTADWADQIESTKIGFDPKKTEKSMGRRAMIGAKSKKMMQRSMNIQKRQQEAVEEKSQLLKNIEITERLFLKPMTYHSDLLLEMRDVTIRYGEKTVCEHINMLVKQGDRIALCGRNGSGKSSILKLICGEDIKYSGTFHKGSRLAVSTVPQDTSFLEGNLSDYAEKHNLDESLFKAILRKLDFSRLQFEKDMRDFSAGQKKKVLIAKSLCEKAHLYIWDEPLNYIDVFSRMQIEEILLSGSATVIFVEHDSAFVDAVSTKKVELHESAFAYIKQNP